MAKIRVFLLARDKCRLEEHLHIREEVRGGLVGGGELNVNWSRGSTRKWPHLGQYQEQIDGGRFFGK